MNASTPAYVPTGLEVEDAARALANSRDGAIPFDHDDFKEAWRDHFRYRARATLIAALGRRSVAPVFYCTTHMCGSCAGCRAAGIHDENSELRAAIRRVRDHIDVELSGFCANIRDDDEYSQGYKKAVERIQDALLGRDA